MQDKTLGFMVCLYSGWLGVFSRKGSEEMTQIGYVWWLYIELRDCITLPNSRVLPDDGNPKRAC